MVCFLQGLRELFVFPLEFFILGLSAGKGRTVLFELSPHLLYGWDITVQQFGNLSGPLLAVKGADAGQQLVQLLALLGEVGHLLEDTRRDMVTARLACALAALQVGVLLDHVFPELVLPPGQLLFVAYDLLGAESAIWCQGDKRKVHMGRLLVHMHHGRNDSFSGLVLYKETEGFLKKLPDFGQLLALEKIRRGGEHHFHHLDAVRSGAAAGGLDLTLGLCPIPAGWLDEVKIVLAAGKVDVGVAGVFFFPALVMGLDVRDLGAFVLGEAHDGVVWLCQGQPSL